MVVGSGLAGLVCARDLTACGWRVTVVSAAGPGRDGASHRVHALAPWILLTAPWSRGDSPDLFLRDLQRRGGGRERPGLAERLAASAHAGARELIGALDLEPLDSEPVLLPGDVHRRGLRCRPRRHGPMLRSLVNDLVGCGSAVVGNAPVVGVLRAGDRAAGVVVLDTAAGTLREIASEAVVLATGGLAAIFPDSTCPRWCRGAAVALASAAGALLHGPNLTQALPVLATPPGYFPSSAAILAGRVLVDGQALPPAADLAALTAELAASERAGRAVELAGPGGGPLTVAVHHSMGGVAIDASGRTSVPALYACGEAAGGVQGARRTMGTGLLEAWVFGRLVAEAVERDHARLGAAPAADDAAMVEPLVDAAMVEATLDRVLTPLKVIRPAAEVRAALEEVARVREPDSHGGLNLRSWMTGIRHRAVGVVLAAELEAWDARQRGEYEARRRHA